MKQFRFGLDRVLDWRRTHARIEEARLEALHAELRSVGTHAQEVARERNTAGRALLASGSATGVELALLDSFHKAADAEMSRLEIARVNCRQRIDAQMEKVRIRHRDVKLLERLKERRLQTWQVEYLRETEEAAAAELHLTRAARSPAH